MTLPHHYVERNPAGFVPDAIWKTMAEIDSLESSLGVENGVVVRLQIGDSGALAMVRFTKRKAYFRLVHRDQPAPAAKLPPGFGIVNVAVDTGAKAVAQLMGRRYDYLCPSVRSAPGWASHRVFDRDSWTWAAVGSLATMSGGSSGAVGLALGMRPGIPSSEKLRHSVRSREEEHRA